MSLRIALLQLLDGDFGHVAHTVLSPVTPLAPRGRPAVLASRDGGSFLVAFEHQDADGAIRIGVLRADCAPRLTGAGRRVSPAAPRR